MNIEANIIALLVSVIIGIFTLFISFGRFRLHRSESKIKTFKLFREMQEICGTDARKNLPVLIEGFQTVTHRYLNSREIEWFLYFPGAFTNIGMYGDGRKYVELDVKANRIIYKEKFRSKKRRVLEHFILLGSYFFFCMLGLIFAYFDLFRAARIPYLSYLIALLAFLHSCKYINSHYDFNDAKSLTKFDFNTLKE